ncbi:MAG: esterase/lipase family protein [Gaiellales bacterium]
MPLSPHVRPLGVALLLALLALVPATAAATGKRAVVLVSGTAATTPFTTPDLACGTGYPAGNTWSFLRDSLVAKGFAVYTAPASVTGAKVEETTSPYDGPFGDCPAQLPPRMTINATGSVDRSGSSVARFVGYLHDRYGITHVDLVGHSLGGLIGRAAVREIKLTRVPVKVRSYTTLGSPWDGAMAADPTNPLKPTSSCDGLPVCEGFVNSLIQIPGIWSLVEFLNPRNAPSWNAVQTGVLDGIPVTMMAGTYFTKPGGTPRKWPNDGVIQRDSALARATPDSVLPHRACLQFPLTHSAFVSAAIGAAPDTSLTGSPVVAEALASTIADAGTALKDPNRSGCPAKPKG